MSYSEFIHENTLMIARKIITAKQNTTKFKRTSLILINSYKIIVKINTNAIKTSKTIDIATLRDRKTLIQFNSIEEKN